MLMIKYPRNFVDEVKRLLPAEATLHSQLEQNSIRVGKELYRLMNGGMSGRLVHKYITEERLVELESAVAVSIEREKTVRRLFNRWRRIINSAKRE